MSLMAVEVCIWHLWLWGSDMAFMAAEFNICH